MKTRKFAFEIQWLLVKALLKGKPEVMYDLRWYNILGIIWWKCKLISAMKMNVPLISLIVVVY